MRPWYIAPFLGLFLASGYTSDHPQTQVTSILIKGGLVIDGSGNSGKIADVRIQGDSILAVGRLQPLDGEKILDASNLVVAPGFIDAHSHTDGAMEKEPMLESQVRQGITTAVVGQDGSSSLPITDFFEKVEKSKPTINFATFAGHGTIRKAVMGDDYKRGSKDSELEKMKALLERAMKDGALGLSTGLEYDPGYYSTTAELVELAKVAAKQGGMYISHIREDGSAGMMQALEELKIISKEAKIPAQINHIKLAVADEWGLGKSICEWIADARKEKADITADVYPYTYWYSTITVLTNDRNWDNREIWVRALADIGGPQNVILARYSPDPSWEGKDLAQIAESSGKDAIAVIQQVIAKTHGPNSKESESIVCKAMKEDDLAGFIKDENIMFCSDGWHGGAHPRGAGSFPRMLGVYVRDKRLITLEEAVRKATSLPAKRFGLLDRGTIKAGMKADIVVFDPFRIKDKATIEDSKALSEGITDVLVNGVPVLQNAGMTGARPGKGLKGHRQFLPISGLEANPQFRMKRSFRGPHLQVDLCP